MPKILAIDTSCDDTSAAVVRDGHVLSNVIVSQTELHAPYGGVFPTVAKQAHKGAIQSVISQALSQAKVRVADLDAIAVTQGPGLAPSLEVGIAAAQVFAQNHQLPLIPVNHLEGHLWSVWANSDEQPTFPALGLVISGGHTFFVKVAGFGEYQVLGETIDDAAGEALDKVGRLLGLGYPAGAKIEELAKQGDASRYPFPLPMKTSGNYNLSFAGMKTSAKNLHTKLTAERPLSQSEVANFCASFQKAVFRAITYKLEKLLINEFTEPVEIWLGGGVAANQTLRQTLTNLVSVTSVRVPPTIDLCRDNAGMIGLVAENKLKHNPGLLSAPLQAIERKPNWPITNVV